MKTIRIKNKKAPVTIMAAPSKLDDNLQAGRKVLMRLMPANIKKANKLFTVDKKYTIQEPPGKHLNTAMSVHLKGKDGNVYQVQFPYWVSIAK